MINYGNFCFASAPRTGTTWFLKACQLAGLKRGFKAHAHTHFREDHYTYLKVSLVRHPYRWLTSYYKAIFPGVIGIYEVDQLRLGVTKLGFERFALDYLEKRPGQIGRIFHSYQADSYLRIEDTPWNAIELFTSAGISKNLSNACRDLAPQNLSKEHTPKYPHLYTLIMEAEKDLVERYEYL